MTHDTATEPSGSRRNFCASTGAISKRSLAKAIQTLNEIEIDYVPDRWSHLTVYFDKLLITRFSHV